MWDKLIVEQGPCFILAGRGPFYGTPGRLTTRTNTNKIPYTSTPALFLVNFHRPWFIRNAVRTDFFTFFFMDPLLLPPLGEEPARKGANTPIRPITHLF